MDQIDIEQKAKILCLKYTPNPLSWKHQFLTKQQHISFDQLRKSPGFPAQRLFQRLQPPIYRKRQESITTPRLIQQSSRFKMYEPNSTMKPYTALNVSKNEEPIKVKLEKIKKPQTAGFAGRKNESFLSVSRRKTQLECFDKEKQQKFEKYEKYEKQEKVDRLEYGIFPNMHISAKAWAIFDGKTGDLIQGFNQYSQRQIASITKIMTCWTALQLCSEFDLDLDTKFIVPEQFGLKSGTSAELQTGDIITIRDLLYGLMLPSGNDAALTLAHNFQQYSKSSNLFLNEMNKWSDIINLRSTRFANVHGLQNDDSNSTAYDVGLMSLHIMKHFTIQKIVRTKLHFCSVEDNIGGSRELIWENTNKMLYHGFKGIKTGNTNKAGPCVVEYFEEDDYCFILVLLNCRTQDQRWIDVQRLLDIAKKEYIS